jgi:hypothetical protein
VAKGLTADYNDGLMRSDSLCIKHFLEAKRMIDVNEASSRAIAHLKTLYPDQDLGKILFEEAELTDDDRFWIITLSYKSPVAASGVGRSVFVGDRSSKVFKLLAENGDIRSVKNREFK